MYYGYHVCGKIAFHLLVVNFFKSVFFVQECQHVLTEANVWLLLRSFEALHVLHLRHIVIHSDTLFLS